MPFDKDECMSQKAGVKAFFKATCCPCVKPLTEGENSMANARVIQVQYLTVHKVQCSCLIYYCGA